MRNVLIIPTFKRPEFLWLCLDHVAACPEALELDIRVYADSHVGAPPPAEEIREVLSRFPQLRPQLRIQIPHSYPGNSYNVMSAYHAAWYGDAEYVFMVEDDVMVFPEFFKWHLEVQEQLHPVVSIALPKKGFNGYASLGVCWRREQLQSIAAHDRHAYYSDMKGYLQKTFPPLPYDYEQDGLICRLVHGKVVAWAEQPHAQHVGWYGYHRPKSQRPVGTVEERYWEIKAILKDPVRLSKAVREFGDVTTLNSACN